MARVSTNSKQVLSAFERFIQGSTQRRMRAMWTYVLRYSPVVTGRYRSVWHISIGRPVYLSRKEGGSPDAPLPPPAMPFLPKTRFRRIYLTNGQPYADQVEYGGLRNRPHAVLRRAIEAAKYA